MDPLLRQIAKMVERDVPLEHVEAHIDCLPVDEEMKAVLWLFAWAGAAPSVVARELGRPGPVASL